MSSKRYLNAARGSRRFTSPLSRCREKVQVWIQCCVVGLLCSTATLAQEFNEDFELWPLDLKINGTIIAANAMDDTAEVEALFLRASGGDEAKIVGLSWRSMDRGEVSLIRERLNAAATTELRTADPTTGQVADLSPLEGATGVILYAGETLPANARDQIVGLRSELLAVVRRGGAIYANNAANRLLSRMEITGGRRLARVAEGLGLVPDSVLETSFSTPDDAMRLKSALVSHPRLVGIGIEKNTAVVLAGRHLLALGDGLVTVMLAANEQQPFRVQKIGERTSHRQRPGEFVIDLTQWRREAIDRTTEPFPSAKPDTPFVRNGALVIAGGGDLPKEVMGRFVELAGGAEQARLVYVPCSEREVLSDNQRTVELWRRMGVKNATFIHTKDRVKANSDRDFYAPLEEATGIWFGGGRQWNFADSYYGTKTHELMKRVVSLGGVVGGSSAGASVQARYLARATPIENVEIMAPGYERGGLGFISGVAIDQHFSQRGRQKDMTKLANRYPQLLGIGIDEGTALIVRGSVATVVGRGKVHFYDRNLPVFPDRDDFVALPAGSRYDLAARTVTEDTSETKEPEHGEAEQENR